MEQEVVEVRDGDVVEILLPMGELVMITPKMRLVIHASKVKVVTPKAFTPGFLLRTMFRAIFNPIVLEISDEAWWSKG